MPHPLTPLRVDTVVKPGSGAVERVDADICVVGAGIAGIQAALEARRLGRRVVLVDALPVLGGQCVNSLIGLFCGVYGNGPEYRQLTHGIFDAMFADLGASGDIHVNVSRTKTVSYDEVVLGRWIEQRVHESGVQPVLGASLFQVRREAGRILSATFATRHGLVEVTAAGFVDASGDAALTWEAGLACRVPERTVWGSQQIRIEGIDETAMPDAADLVERVDAKADEYGLVRRDGLAFVYPGRHTAVMNMTHVEAPLSAVAASRAQLEGRDQADRVVRFLRREFPAAFGDARVRAYGFPGRRQTRWIASEHMLTVDEVRSGRRFEDAVARTAWPIELHDRPEGYVWETFGPEHVHYVPLRSMIPRGSDNVVAAGRCVDGDAAALSSVRVMGACAAMGFAAAHVLDMAGDSRAADVDPAELADRVRENVGDE
ncbi:FAD-dependent oxidoreductase [Microbacterium sp. 18062]|uniref:FAD-dependent oxidoreductase n=1 Tax=Microbacterium sp. 18062 TaxID=2681410 RepID=UPI001357019D|nr:FAD-dependent oxidoreductase [Microbacterium sp. 18062]